MASLGKDQLFSPCLFRCSENLRSTEDDRMSFLPTSQILSLASSSYFQTVDSALRNSVNSK